jgi:hypothetical protein
MEEEEGVVTQDEGFILWRKKKLLPSTAGPGFGCLFIMHGRVFHARRLWKPLPSTAGPGFRCLFIMHGRFFPRAQALETASLSRGIEFLEHVHEPDDGGVRMRWIRVDTLGRFISGVVKGTTDYTDCTD